MTRPGTARSIPSRAPIGTWRARTDLTESHEDRRHRLDRPPPAARSVRAVGAGRLDPHRGARRARPRRHPVRHRRLPRPPPGCTPTAPHGYEEAPGLDAKVWEGLHIAAAFERAGEFDVIANHFDFLPLTYSRLVRRPW